MSTTTCRISECAEDIRSACDHLLTIAPVASPEDVHAFCEVVRLNAAMIAGLGKSLAGASSVQSGGHGHDLG